MSLLSLRKEKVIILPSINNGVSVVLLTMYLIKQNGPKKVSCKYIIIAKIR